MKGCSCYFSGSGSPSYPGLPATATASDYLQPGSTVATQWTRLVLSALLSLFVLPPRPFSPSASSLTPPSPLGGEGVCICMCVSGEMERGGPICTFLNNVITVILTPVVLLIIVVAGEHLKGRSFFSRKGESPSWVGEGRGTELRSQGLEMLLKGFG